MSLIKSVRHECLRAYFETGSTAGVQASHGERLRMQRAALDTAQAIGDMGIPGFRLHPLKERMGGRGAVTVNGHWRLAFEFLDANACSPDYEGGH